MKDAFIPGRYDDDVLQEAKALNIHHKKFSKRQKIEGYTIDSFHSKDLDDGINLEINDDIYSIEVSISDVTSMISINSALFNTAHQRIITRYLTELNVAMLPEIISEDKLSLLPGGYKPALTFCYDIYPDGEVKNFHIKETLFKNLRKLSYYEFDAIANSEDSELGFKCKKLGELANMLLESRRSKGALAIYDLVKGIYTNEEGVILPLQKENANIGNIVIQELMILTNKLVAQFFAKQDILFLYRNHTVRSNAPERSQILEQINMAILNSQFLESLRERSGFWFNKAEYGTSVIGHYGLNEAIYCHVTSPIRRFADMLNHYIIKSYLHKTETPFNSNLLNSYALQINKVVAKYKNQREEFFKKQELNRNYIKMGLLSETDYFEMDNTQFYGVLRAAAVFDELNDNILSAIKLRFQENRIDTPLIYILFFKTKEDSVSWFKIKKMAIDFLSKTNGLPAQLLGVAHQKYYYDEFNLNTYSSKGGFRTDGFVMKKNAKVEFKATQTFKRKKDSQQDTAINIIKSIPRIKIALDYLEKLESGINLEGNDYISNDNNQNEASNGKLELTNGINDSEELNSAVNEDELSFNIDENYVSKLLEFTVKHKFLTNPEYSFSLSGPDHQPKIICTCKLNYNDNIIEKSAEKGNKKSAKQLVTYLVLKDLEFLGLMEEVKQSAYVINENENYIGLLQEFCVQNKLVAPDYSYEQMGSSHEPTFICTVKVNFYNEILTFQEFGSNKKLSKQNVAEKCLNHLFSNKDIQKI